MIYLMQVLVKMSESRMDETVLISSSKIIRDAIYQIETIYRERFPSAEVLVMSVHRMGETISVYPTEDGTYEFRLQ